MKKVLKKFALGFILSSMALGLAVQLSALETEEGDIQYSAKARSAAKELAAADVLPTAQELAERVRKAYRQSPPLKVEGEMEQYWDATPHNVMRHSWSSVMGKDRFRLNIYEHSDDGRARDLIGLVRMYDGQMEEIRVDPATGEETRHPFEAPKSYGSGNVHLFRGCHFGGLYQTWLHPDSRVSENQASHISKAQLVEERPLSIRFAATPEDVEEVDCYFVQRTLRWGEQKEKETLWRYWIGKSDSLIYRREIRHYAVRQDSGDPRIWRTFIVKYSPVDDELLTNDEFWSAPIEVPRTRRISKEPRESRTLRIRSGKKQ